MLSCAVIGCGPGGMAAATALRQAGLMVTVFEMASQGGGIWASDPTATHSPRGLLSPIPPAMRCVIPKDLMAFSDLQMYSTIPQHPHYSAVSDYLRRYGEQRGINAITRFNTKVESVRFDEAQQVWKLISVGLVNSDAYEWSFDRIVVATGQTHAPRYPPEATLLKDFSESSGTVTHSCFVKYPREFSRKRVVVVGDGVSAYDMCQQLTHVGADVVHSTHLEPEADPTPPLLSFDALAGGSAALQRGVNLTSLAAALPWRRRSEHHAQEVIAGLMRHKHGYKAPRRVGRVIGLEGERDILVRADPTQRMGVGDVMDRLDQMGTTADVADVPQEELVTDVNAVIFATGFHTKYPFLPQDIRAVVESSNSQTLLTEGDGEPEKGESVTPGNRGLYRGCVWAANPTLGFVGILPDAFPPFLIMEAQSHYLGKVLTGKRTLPVGEAEMLNDDRSLVEQHPGLTTLFPERGLGLTSSQYYNALMSEPSDNGVPAMKAPQSFAEAILRRKWWFLKTWALHGINRTRGMAPLKRQQQHVLISNKV